MGFGVVFHGQNIVIADSTWCLFHILQDRLQRKSQGEEDYFQ